METPLQASSRQATARQRSRSTIDEVLSDDVVDGLLRDRDFLLTREIKHRIEELNQLFDQASSQSLRIELETSTRRSSPDTPVTRIDVTVLKEI